MTGVRDLNHDGFNHGQIQAGRHPIVQEAGVLHQSVLAVDVFLVERPADPLGHAALHLTFHIAGMDGPSNVLDSRVAQHVHLAGFLVHGHVNHMGCKARSHTAWVDGRATRDRTAGPRQLAGEFLEGHGFVAVLGTGEDTILKHDFIRIDLPGFGRPPLELIQHILRGFIHGRPGSKGDPAAAGHIRMANGFGIGHNRVDFFCLEAEHLRRNHGARRPRATNIG